LSVESIGWTFASESAAFQRFSRSYIRATLSPSGRLFNEASCKIGQTSIQAPGSNLKTAVAKLLVGAQRHGVSTAKQLDRYLAEPSSKARMSILLLLGSRRVVRVRAKFNSKPTRLWKRFFDECVALGIVRYPGSETLVRPSLPPASVAEQADPSSSNEDYLKQSSRTSSPAPSEVSPNNQSTIGSFAVSTLSSRKLVNDAVPRLPLEEEGIAESTTTSRETSDSEHSEKASVSTRPVYYMSGYAGTKSGRQNLRDRLIKIAPQCLRIEIHFTIPGHGTFVGTGSRPREIAEGLLPELTERGLVTQNS